MIRSIFIAFLLFWSSAALAAPEGIRQITPGEFRDLAAELAPKVNFFSEVWKEAPDAEFYGGTTRDYLYWIKGHFQQVRSRAEAELVIRELRALPFIDVRDFIIGDSDVDVITNSRVGLNPEHYGITKLDIVSPDILNPATEKGANEIHQGYIPAEKVRLSKQGASSSAGLGDGLREIYEGKLSVHFAPAAEFAKTHYAAQKLNHPVLLATRYLRLQAMNYFYTYGGGVPDPAKLDAAMSAEDASRVQAVIDSTLDGKELRPYLEKPQFKKWLNGNVQKAFRSYTNPTAALTLLKKFRVPEMVGRYEGLEPINKYVFAKYREPASTKKIHGELGIKENFYISPLKEFSDGFLYHGTKREEDFRAILLQGILPSEGGSAGPGLYGVAIENRSFSEKWGGDKNLLLRFPVKPDAKIVDITQGEGKRVWEIYGKRFGEDLDAFAESVDADIIKYPYKPDAYVVKNSDALLRAEGVHRQVLSFSRALKATENARTDEDLFRLREDLKLSRFSASEVESLVRVSPNIGRIPIIRDANLQNTEKNFEDLFFAKDSFGEALRQVYAGGLLEKSLEQVDSGEAFLRWLSGSFELYGAPVELRTYGGMNSDLPAFSRLQTIPRVLPSAQDLTAWIKKIESKGLLKKDSFSLPSAEDRRRALKILTETNHLNFPALERLRKAVYESLSRPAAPLSPEGAYRKVRPLLAKKYYFAEPGDLLFSLLTLTDASSLPESTRSALRNELIGIHREIAASTRIVPSPSNRNPKEAWGGMRLWERFLESDAIEDYPKLVQRFLLDRPAMQINGYVSPGSTGLDTVLKAEDRQVRSLVPRSQLMSRAMSESDLNPQEWRDFFLRPDPYYRSEGSLDRLLKQGWNPESPLLDMLLEEETQKGFFLHKKYTEREANFFLERFVAHPEFNGAAGASQWARYFFGNLATHYDLPNSASGPALLKALPNLLALSAKMPIREQKKFMDDIVLTAPSEALEEIKEALGNSPWIKHPRRDAWLQALGEANPELRSRHLSVMATLKHPSRWPGSCASFFRGLTEGN